MGKRITEPSLRYDLADGIIRWSLQLGEIPGLETTVIFVLGTDQESIFRRQSASRCQQVSILCSSQGSDV